jgi:hypothetical protein
VLGGEFEAFEGSSLPPGVEHVPELDLTAPVGFAEEGSCNITLPVEIARGAMHQVTTSRFIRLADCSHPCLLSLFGRFDLPISRLFGVVEQSGDVAGLLVSMQVKLATNPVWLSPSSKKLGKQCV